MLNPAEADAVATRFGVALAQVRRDHLISHLLTALTALVGDQVVFFGGTALARTLVPDGRLSEDIDLLARASRSSVATTIQRDLTRLLRREYPGLTWDPELTAVRDTEPAVLRDPEGTTVRVQLLNAADYQPWPVTPTELTQRYTDAAPARLLVPTPAAFAAWKTVTWLDRHASRDLYDLWSLARLGHINAHAAELFTHHGPTNRPPAPWMFDKPPAETDWRRDLASQTHLEVTANQALTLVRSAWCPTQQKPN